MKKNLLGKLLLPLTLLFLMLFGTIQDQGLAYTSADNHRANAPLFPSGSSQLPSSLIMDQPEKTEAVDLVADALEVTQGIQDLNNGVFLVAGKKTYVRFHVYSTNGTHIADASLFVGSGNSFFELWPKVIYRNRVHTGPIYVRENPDRGVLHHSFLFEIPDAHPDGTPITWGNVSFSAVLNTGRLSPLVPETDTTNNTINKTVYFSPRIERGMNVVFYRLGYSIDGIYHPPPPESDLNRLIRYLEAMYPVANINYEKRVHNLGNFEAMGDPKGPDNQLGFNDIIWFLRSVREQEAEKFNPFATHIPLPGLQRKPSNTRYYGLTDNLTYVLERDGNSGTLAGLADGIPSGAASGNNNLSTGAHELGHVYGRYHAEFCGAEAFTPPQWWEIFPPENPQKYPYANGNISPQLSGDEAIYGFNSVSWQVYPPSSKDIMTYCNHRWIGPYSYQFLYDKIDDPVDQPELSQATYFSENLPLPIPVAESPEFIVVNSELNKVYVVNYDNTVTVINGNDESTVQVTTSAWGANKPRFNQTTNKLYLLGYESLLVMDGTDNSVQSIDTGGLFIKPREIAVNEATNMVYVTEENDNYLLAINGNTDQMTNRLPISGIQSLEVNPETNKIYAGAGASVTIFDGATFTETTSLPTSASVRQLLINPVSNKIYAYTSSGNLVVIDGTTNIVLTTVPIGLATDLAINTVTNKIYVSLRNGEFKVVDGQTDTVVTTIDALVSDPQEFSHDSDFLAVNERTNQIYWASIVDDEVLYIDGEDYSLLRVGVGQDPLAVAVNPKTSLAYAVNYTDSTVTVVPPPIPSLQVQGTIDLSATSFDIDLATPFVRPDYPVIADDGSFAIVLRDANGDELTRYPFTPRQIHATFQAETQSTDLSPYFLPALSIGESVPHVLGTARIDIEGPEGELITTIKPGLDEPTITVTSPNGGEIVSIPFPVTWEATDPDGDPISFDVEFVQSTEDGDITHIIAADIKDTSYTIDTTGVVGEGRIRVRASDGLNTTVDLSDATFTVNTRAVEADIIQPSGILTIPLSQTLTLEGVAFDPNVGRPVTITWVSSIDGLIGTGDRIATSFLSEGQHQIWMKYQNAPGWYHIDPWVRVNVVSDPSLLPPPPDYLRVGPDTIFLDPQEGIVTGTVYIENLNLDQSISWEAAIEGDFLKQAVVTGSTPGEFALNLKEDDLPGAGTYISTVTITSPDVPEQSEIIEVVLEIRKYDVYLPAILKHNP